jgi:hypothetical protein
MSYRFFQGKHVLPNWQPQANFLALCAFQVRNRAEGSFFAAVGRLVFHPDFPYVVTVHVGG